MSDILGKALLDYHRGQRDETLWINNKYGEPEEMPVAYYFRGPDELPELEAYALTLCKGQVLDVGAGAGAHALPLQENSVDVDALEISSNACTVLKERGVKNVLNQNIFATTRKTKYDTVLLLMNGLGIAQDIAGLKRLLTHLKQFLDPTGQILFDSSDIHYLYDNKIDPAEKPTDRYYGEIEYQYQYKGEKGEWFKWLYIDYAFCAELATEMGFQPELLAQDDEGHFLGRLTLK